MTEKSKTPLIRQVRAALGRSRQSLARFLCRHGYGKRTKIFGIGRNKTGTTSLQAALKDLGYRVAPTSLGERLLPHWINRDFEPIVKFCRDFDAFQDIPFGLPETYKSLDTAFPGSKFILTVRDSEDQWLASLKKFHAKMFGTDGNVPTWDELKNSPYRWKGFIAECQIHIYGAEKHGLYDDEGYKSHYLNHNQTVRDYFASRSDDFLELNVSRTDSYRALCTFLGVRPRREEFPWSNRTEEDG